MNEELKTVVDSVNKMLDTNYNLMSFDSLSNMNLLQVLGDVLVKLGIIEKVSGFIYRLQENLENIF